MLLVFQNEINVVYPSERINVGVQDLSSNGFLRLRFVGKEHIQRLGVFWVFFLFLIARLFFFFSANPAYHELLLTVLWYGVVHTSALVRCTAARMFEVSVIQTFLHLFYF